MSLGSGNQRLPTPFLLDATECLSLRHLIPEQNQQTLA
jgi:hypothetical protein